MKSSFLHSKIALFFVALAISFICVIPAIAQVTLTSNWGAGGATGWTPPDTNAAVGPNYILEWTNDNMVIYNKSGTYISSESASTFFGVNTIGDGHVIYNEITQRYAFEVLETLSSGGNGTVGFAVSDTNNPTGTWHMTTISVPGLWDGYGANGIGYNNDAYVVHVNGFNNYFAVIATANNVNLAYTLQQGPSNVRIGRPAPMPGSATGSPFYFVEGNSDGANGTGGTNGWLEVVKVTNILTGSPTYTDYQIHVNNLSTAAVNCYWRTNQLAVIGNSSPMDWYLLNTGSGVTLSQNGYITSPDGGSLTLPSIAIGPNGNIGMNFVSITGSAMTTYLTGRASSDPTGFTQLPQQLISGANSNGRIGDYSSCTVDVNTSGVPQNTFWASNEYMNTTDQFDWLTRIANFTVGSSYSFETPSIGSGNYQYNPTGSAWTFSGNSGIVANGSGFGNPNAPNGVQAAFVQDVGSMSMPVSGFIVGQTYKITFSAATRSAYEHGGQSWNVQVGNTVVGSYNPGAGATSYATYTATFTATATTNTLSFVGTDLNGPDNTIFIDNVQIAAASTFPADAGFETPGIGTYNYQYNPSGASWTFNGSPGSGSGIVANGSGFGNPNAPEGGQAAFVQGSGTITQSVSGFTSGATYKITFSAAERSGYNEAWNLKVGSNVIGSFNPGAGATSYVDYSATFTATAATNTLSFVGNDLAGNQDAVFIDNVRITLVPPSAADSGFETPSVGSGGYQYNPSGAPWAFSGSGGNGSGIVGNGSGFGNPNAPEGVQAAFIQGVATISQSIPGFVSGRTYTITFSAAQRTYENGGQTWNLKIGSTVIGSYNPGPGATSYVDYTANFTATATTNTLTFAGTDLNTGDNTIFIDNVRIAAVEEPARLGSLPSPWETQPIGQDSIGGDASYANGTFTITASGDDIGGTNDSFRFLYQPSSGNCKSTVRVASLQNATQNAMPGIIAMAGVTIRESTDDDASGAGVWVTPDNGLMFTVRTTTGGPTQVTTLPSTGVPIPYWVKITRTGNVFRAHYSADGTNWKQLGKAVTIPMSTSAYIGMGVASGQGEADTGNGILFDTVTMDHVKTTP